MKGKLHCIVCCPLDTIASDFGPRLQHTTCLGQTFLPHETAISLIERWCSKSSMALPRLSVHCVYIWAKDIQWLIHVWTLDEVPSPSKNIVRSGHICNNDLKITRSHDTECWTVLLDRTAHA